MTTTHNLPTVPRYYEVSKRMLFEASDHWAESLAEFHQWVATERLEASQKGIDVILRSVLIAPGSNTGCEICHLAPEISPEYPGVLVGSVCHAKNFCQIAAGLWTLVFRNMIFKPYPTKFSWQQICRGSMQVRSSGDIKSNNHYLGKGAAINPATISPGSGMKLNGSSGSI